MSKNIHVFTHHDLDGIGSLLTIIWAFPDANITYTTVNSNSVFEFDKFIKSWNKDLSQYDRVFVLDLSIPEKFIYLIDKENVIFIDHHKSSLNLKFDKASSFIKIYTSCIRYIYEIFKNIIDIDKKQQELIVYIDDYDSYQLKFKKSKELNTLFWEFYNNSVSLFLSEFNEGIFEFNTKQKSIINFDKQKLEKIKSNLDLFETTTVIQNKKCKIVSTFATTHINDIAEYLTDKFNADIAFIINLKSERVSFRRNKNCIVDVSLLSQALCDGSGHEAAAGGKLTEKFMTFSKLFKPLNASS